MFCSMFCSVSNQHRIDAIDIRSLVAGVRAKRVLPPSICAPFWPQTSTCKSCGADCAITGPPMFFPEGRAAVHV
eukprot:COSAG02_NODE_59867_length_273_cov_0.586207_1_plen_73_part_01